MSPTLRSDDAVCLERLRTTEKLVFVSKTPLYMTLFS